MFSLKSSSLLSTAQFAQVGSLLLKEGFLPTENSAWYCLKMREPVPSLFQLRGEASKM